MIKVIKGNNMDTVLEIDATGNGRVILYRWGKTWRIEVKEWVCQPLPYQPPETPLTIIAQRAVNEQRQRSDPVAHNR